MKKITTLLIVSIFLFNACNTLQIHSDYDKNANFSKYKTFSYYGWSEESGELINEFDKKRIEKAFGSEFLRRDLKFVKENGDIVVSLFIQVDTKTSTRAYINHYNMGGAYGYYGYQYNPGWGWGVGYATTSYENNDYLVGTLVVDVFDSKTKKLVWQSVGSKTIYETAKKREKNAPRIASSMMKPFPIKPVKK